MRQALQSPEPRPARGVVVNTLIRKACLTVTYISFTSIVTSFSHIRTAAPQPPPLLTSTVHDNALHTELQELKLNCDALTRCSLPPKLCCSLGLELLRVTIW